MSTTSAGSPRLGCDRPLGRDGIVAHNELVLSGWATSPVGITGVAVQIDDRVWNASYGLDTPAGPGSPKLPDSERTGYRLQIDTSTWSPRTYYVTVAAFDREGGRSALEGPVEVLPFEAPLFEPPESLASAQHGEIAMRLDPPLLDADMCDVVSPLRVSGWACADAGIEKVLVTLDDRIQREALMPIVRPDLLSRFGPEVAAGAGFASQIDPAECPPGEHSLSVVAFSSAGTAAGFERTLTCLPSPRRRAEAGGDIQWLEDAPRPRKDDPEKQRLPRDEQHAATLMWEDRALLAEADAAISRAELEFAQASLERAAAELQELHRGNRSGGEA